MRLTRREIGLGLAVSSLGSRGEAAPPAWQLKFQAMNDALRRQGRYRPILDFMKAVQEPAARGLAQQWAAMVGDEAYALADAGGTEGPPPNLANATADEAVAAIVRASAGRRVVFLNESHSASRHRLFLARLLRALRAEGFTHLAAETFSNPPKPGATPVGELSAGKQVGFMHGSYVADPVFAESVREALDLGYRLVAYEQRQDQNVASADGATQIAAREQAQAENFTAALSAAPEGSRFLVHVGFSHLREGPDGKGNLWFAARLKTLTGIDPLTVSQASSGAFGPHGRDPPGAAAVIARFRPLAPVVVTLPDAGVLGAGIWSADMAVFHPSLPDIAGRPGWLAMDTGRRAVRVALKSPPADQPVLAQAIHASDADPAIPADQYVLPAGSKALVSYLRPGRYQVRLEAAAGFASLGRVTVAT